MEQAFDNDGKPSGCEIIRPPAIEPTAEQILEGIDCVLGEGWTRELYDSLNKGAK